MKVADMPPPSAFRVSVSLTRDARHFQVLIGESVAVKQQSFREWGFCTFWHEMPESIMPFG